MYSFVQNRKYAYVVAAVLFIFSIFSPFILPFHQGIDLTGGVQATYSTQTGNVDEIISKTKNNFLTEAESSLSEAEKNIITDSLVYKITGTNDFMVEVGIDESMATGDANAKNELVNSAKTNFFNNLNTLYEKENLGISQLQYVNIGASFGEYIKNSGYFSLALVAVMISIYIMYAFSGAIPGVASWPFALVTGLSLVHDVVIAFGMYVVVSAIFPMFKIDIYLMTAMLTVLGYSINDSIVIMDRVRATLKKDKKRSIDVIIDESIHSTMRRSIFTSVTILIVLVAMFVFGPEAIK